jgi:mRNA-degrading endonuclease RelE of RelBE toxin-antitoxin system
MVWEFIELPPFAALRDDLFTDEEFLALQVFLCEHPDAGDVIPETGGCRKLRWAAKGKGKRGGARVIYFIRRAEARLILVTAYGKGEREDVPRAWLKHVKEVFSHEQG